MTNKIQFLLNNMFFYLTNCWLVIFEINKHLTNPDSFDSTPTS